MLSLQRQLEVGELGKVELTTGEAVYVLYKGIDSAA